jgi:NADH:ubiquinone oxidoreductase subunit 5 (subunit L)/multisubunit Na+/H+ antiporter MnhA subunit
VHWGEHAHEAVEGGGHLIVLASSLAAFLLGLVGATWVYFLQPTRYEWLAKTFAAPYKLISQRYRFDELYLWVIDRVYYPVAHLLAKFDFDVFDQKVVDGVGRAGVFFSWFGGLFDYNVVDQIGIDGQARWIQMLSRGLRKLQSGLAQSYLFWMVVGVGSMLVWITQHFK